MNAITKRFTRRTLLLSLLTLAAFKRLTGQSQQGAKGEQEKTVLSGGWILKKSDLS